MKTIGRHLIAEYYGCDSAVLRDLAAIRAALLAAAKMVGATVVGDTFHRFAPGGGVSGSVVIAESHLSIHTWPEQLYAAVDIFTCGGLNPRPGFHQLKTVLAADEARMQEILRGVPEDLAGQAPLLPGDVQIVTEIAPLR